MPKRVAVIDLGSNSVRLAIFQRTSRLGFFLLKEYKIKARLGEGAYEKAGMLQDEAMDKLYGAFKEFKYLISLNGVRKVLCVGTSALRDAPNAKVFIKRIKNDLGLNLKVIDGKTEAFYGAIAALNLLSPFEDGVTLDIGGGSSELAIIKNGKIEETISLDLGTVRLKELFYDKNNIKDVNKFIDSALETLPQSFKSKNLIAIGGSLRALSKAVIANTNYPIKFLHNFIYSFDKHKEFIDKLALSKVLELKNYPIKKERYDTIREGALVFLKIAQKLGAKNIITSGVGVREGVFLSNLLRPNIKFQSNFNPSLKSLEDRFSFSSKNFAPRHAKILFDIFKTNSKLSDDYLKPLLSATKLFEVGENLSYYQRRFNSAYFAEYGLNYGYTHEELALISTLIKYQRRDIKIEQKSAFLLPNLDDLKWLNFILSLSIELSIFPRLEFEYSQNTLHIKGLGEFNLLKNNIKHLPKPAIFAVSFN